MAPAGFYCSIPLESFDEKVAKYHDYANSSDIYLIKQALHCTQMLLPENEAQINVRDLAAVPMVNVQTRISPRQLARLCCATQDTIALLEDIVYSAVALNSSSGNFVAINVRMCAPVKPNLAYAHTLRSHTRSLAARLSQAIVFYRTQLAGPPAPFVPPEAPEQIMKRADRMITELEEAELAFAEAIEHLEDKAAFGTVAANHQSVRWHRRTNGIDLLARVVATPSQLCADAGAQVRRPHLHRHRLVRVHGGTLCRPAPAN